jgi:hypothetical protein
MPLYGAEKTIHDPTRVGPLFSVTGFVHAVFFILGGKHAQTTYSTTHSDLS